MANAEPVVMQVSGEPVSPWIEASKLTCDALSKKQRPASNCRAVRGFLGGETPWSASDKFVRVVDQSSLDTAGRTYYHARTGVKPARQAKIPLPDGWSVYALGLDGKDPVEMSLNSFIWQYVGHAITIAFAAANGDVPAVMRVNTTNGAGVVCMILCVATPQPFCTLLLPTHSTVDFPAPTP